MIKSIYIIFLFILISSFSFSQNDGDQKALYNKSLQAFDAEDFKSALPLLLKYDSLYPDNYEVIYRIGACYLNTEFDKITAISYLERAMKEEKDAYPAAAIKDLAEIYHLNYQFDKSEKMYARYIELRPKKKEAVDAALNEIKNARKLIKDSLYYKIENVGRPVNTMHSEIIPYVSADESILYYQEREDRNIYLANYKYDKWFRKVKLDIPNLNNYQIVKFAGISHDGEQIFIQLGDSSNTDIYYGKNFLKTCNQLIPFNSNINSPYQESTLSIVPDNNTLYFSSNRPGGFGGFDIYKCEKDEQGEWGPAINLGPVINSSKDEISPFIHPNKKKLFFSSNGHQTMGGYDIFEATNNNGVWGKVKNIGYPINTTYDDMSYSMTAKGDAAYFSSTRNNKTRHFDIYKVYLKENIPLTLVKGRILAGNPPKPVKTEIQVIDKLTQKPLKYIYNPNPKTGNYLLVFPPGKDYDMVIKADGYKPYIINIYLPNQSYFYENFQEIFLQPIIVNSLGETVGEEIKIKNTFYDVTKNPLTLQVDSAQEHKYDKLLGIINELIEQTDTLGLNHINNYSEDIEKEGINKDSIEQSKDYDKLFSLVEEAIETTDSTTLKILDENAIPNYSFENRYFYSKDSNNDEFNKIVVNSDTVFAIKLSDKKNNKRIDTSIVNEKRLTKFDVKHITECSVYFDKNKSEIKKKYKTRLTEIAQLLLNNPNLYVEITGKANQEEDSQMAVSRAIELRSYLVNKNLPIEKTKTKAIFNTEPKSKKDQRVDVRIFESNSPIYKAGEFSSAVKLEETANSSSTLRIASGTEYKVQIAAGAVHLFPGDKFFKGEEVTFYMHHHLYKYVIGSFDTFRKANKERKRLIRKGFRGAFIVKFKDGKRLD